MSKPKHTIKEIFELGEKRTRGEWICVEDGGTTYVSDSSEIEAVYQQNKGNIICDNEDNYPCPVDEDDMRYIAAAPSMEAWLKEVVELLPNIVDELDYCIYSLNDWDSEAKYHAEVEAKKIQDKLKDLMKRAGI